jgi:mercuric reductase
VRRASSEASGYSSRRDAPNTAALALDRAGVSLGAPGEVLVNEYLQTSNPNVYAAGDVTLAPQFVDVAAYQGTLAVENALDENRRVVDPSALPGVIFTNPAIVSRDTHGVFKLVADANTDQVLGVHVMAENTGDVIYTGVLAVKLHLTIHDLVERFAPCLTMAEVLKLAA